MSIGGTFSFITDLSPDSEALSAKISYRKASMYAISLGSFFYFVEIMSCLEQWEGILESDFT